MCAVPQGTHTRIDVGGKYMQDVEVRKRVRELDSLLRREVKKLQLAQNALTEHLGVVVHLPYVDAEGIAFNLASVREKCKECGK